MVGSTRNRLALTSLIIGGIGGALLFGGLRRVPIPHRLSTGTARATARRR